MHPTRSVLRVSAAVAGVVVFVAGSHGVFAQGSWTAKAPITSPLYGPVSGVINGRLYAAANETHAYDPATDTWTARATMPAPRYYASGGVMGGKLYVAGGCVSGDCGGSGTTSAVHAYDPATDSWAARNPMPMALTNAASGVINGKLYVAGGQAPCGPCTVYSTLLIYDPATDSWTTGASMSAPRCQCAAAVVDGRLHVVGGQYAGAHLTTHEMYDPATDTWTTLMPMPTPHDGLTASSVSGALLAIGGLNGGLLSHVVEAYDSGTGTWTTMTPIPADTYLASSSVVNGIVYVVGGVVNPTLNEAFDSGLSVNLAPIANAGPDFAIDENTSGLLDGSGSYDPEGQPLTYAWRQVAGPAVMLTPGAGGTASFVAPNVNAGGATLTFQLVVSDGSLSSTPDTIDVTIRNVNHPPVANAGDDQTVSENSMVTLSGVASFDVDGDAIGYLWLQTGGPLVTLSDPASATPTFVAPQVSAAGTTLTFVLQVSDGILDSTDPVVIHVTNVNQTPVVSAGAGFVVDESTAVSLAGTASDPDGDALTFSWTQVSGPAVALSGATTLTPSFTAPTLSSGNVQLVFRLTASDGLASATSHVTVGVRDVVAPPDCSHASPSTAVLWPPNHGMVPITIEGVRAASGASSNSIQIAITSVTQDEPTNGLGDGDTAIDAVIQQGRVLIRAERSGTGNGRVYCIHFRATDALGQSCLGSVLVSVPIAQKKNSPAIDDGQIYSSTN